MVMLKMGRFGDIKELKLRDFGDRIWRIRERVKSKMIT